MSPLPALAVDVVHHRDQALAACATWAKRNPGRVPRLNRLDHLESRVAMWLAEQNRRADSLTPGDILSLNSTFPMWRRVSVDPFEAKLHHIALFSDEHTRLPSPASEDAAERNMGEWLARKASRGADGTLLLREAKSLDTALPGWRDVKRTSPGRMTPMPKRSLSDKKPAKRRRVRTWESTYREFREFHEKAHRTPMRSKPDEQVLARWVDSQRTSISAGRLDDHRLYQFLAVVADSTLIILRPNPEQFDLGVERLRASLERSGSSTLVHPDPEDDGLLQWLTCANIFYFRGELSEEQTAALDSVDSEWREFRRV